MTWDNLSYNIGGNASPPTIRTLHFLRMSWISVNLKYSSNLVGVEPKPSAPVFINNSDNLNGSIDCSSLAKTTGSPFIIVPKISLKNTIKETVDIETNLSHLLFNS